MHSHDRTLLAKLGFADRDKQNPLHDLACQYLVQPEQAARLVAMCPGRGSPPPPCRLVLGAYDRFATASEASWLEAEARHIERREEHEEETSRDVMRVETEMALAKGEGQYKTVVGFVDAVIQFGIRWRTHGLMWKPKRRSVEVTPASGIMGPASKYKSATYRDEWTDEPVPFSEQERFAARAMVEVKIAECSIGDILRQIKLYREFGDGRSIDAWFVAVAYKVTTHFVDEMRREGIQVITLGPKFKQWIEARRRNDQAEVEEL
jgi:hypothetical protein